MFLSPMFPKSREQYKATETQAIGRARRYGQTKTVNVWRFIARDTIDVELYTRYSGVNYQTQADLGLPPPAVPGNITSMPSPTAEPAFGFPTIAASLTPSDNDDVRSEVADEAFQSEDATSEGVDQTSEVEVMSEAPETDAEMELDLHTTLVEHTDQGVEDAMDTEPNNGLAQPLGTENLEAIAVVDISGDTQAIEADLLLDTEETSDNDE